MFHALLIFLIFALPSDAENDKKLQNINETNSRSVEKELFSHFTLRFQQPKFRNSMEIVQILKRSMKLQ